MDGHADVWGTMVPPSGVLSLYHILSNCLAARKPATRSCRACHPFHIVIHPGLPVRLLSVKPPSFAIVRAAHARGGGSGGGFVFLAHNHRTTHSSCSNALLHVVFRSAVGNDWHKLSFNCSRRTATNAVIISIRSRLSLLCIRNRSAPTPLFHALWYSSMRHRSS